MDEAMIRFANGDGDILLSTNIIQLQGRMADGGSGLADEDASLCSRVFKCTARVLNHYGTSKSHQIRPLSRGVLFGDFRWPSVQ